jgi:glycerol kinase
MEQEKSAKLILTIDQGTTSSKVGILDDKGQKLLFFKGKDHEQIT